ncbi:MAG: hypothetical protein JO166_11450 [Deltaproteobacteria bacterium]|nr:hypothetical protein [Deltaproteobacteria bacterium]
MTKSFSSEIRDAITPRERFTTKTVQRKMNNIRKLFAACTALIVLSNPVAAFDTMWHAQATQKVGEEYGFSKDAAGVMKLGNFSPDLFGPVQDYAAEHLDPEQRRALQTFGIKNARARAAAVFLHFDNLEGKLDQNSKFDYIFNQLLTYTRKAVAYYQLRRDLDEATRNSLILVTLGASLHTVQDFYSHSDWIHQEFDLTPVKMVRSGLGQLRAPTWFEVRDRLGNPNGWPFVVKSGIYPPVAGELNTHTHMNHDNSRLIYRELENPGQPLLSQAQYHQAGPLPARPGNEPSIFQHQQLAVDTATAASVEWVRLVEQDPATRAAVESAKSWKLKDQKLQQELQAGLALELSLSCAAGRWDGEDPPSDRGILCRVMNERLTAFLSGNTLPSRATTGLQSQLQNLAGGIGAAVIFPSALQYAGEFWKIHTRYEVLDRLTKGFGSDTGGYSFSQDRSGANRGVGSLESK